MTRKWSLITTTRVIDDGVLTISSAGLYTYIGDLDMRHAKVLSDLMARGLVRLEGFVQRLQPEAVSYNLPQRSKHQLT